MLLQTTDPNEANSAFTITEFLTGASNNASDQLAGQPLVRIRPPHALQASSPGPREPAPSPLQVCPEVMRFSA